MIRYFEVFGFDGDAPDYFGFMDTVTDCIIELDGCQFFGDYKDFLDYLGTSDANAKTKALLDGLIPDHMKFASQVEREP
jgi:hypothetical protein